MNISLMHFIYQCIKLPASAGTYRHLTIQLKTFVSDGCFTTSQWSLNKVQMKSRLLSGKLMLWDHLPSVYMHTNSTNVTQAAPCEKVSSCRLPVGPSLLSKGLAIYTQSLICEEAMWLQICHLHCQTHLGDLVSNTTTNTGDFLNNLARLVSTDEIFSGRV